LRIYLDKNIFSYLRTNDQYKDLLQKIENSIEQHTFFFSKAHIEDLKNDKTEMKYKDLDFIKRIAGKNYLCKCWKKPTNCYNVSPREAFKAAKEESIDFNLKEILEHPLFKEKAKQVESFFLGSERPSAEVSMFHPLLNDYLNNIFSQTDNFNIEKLINDGLDFYNSLNNDRDVYKSLRRYLKENQQVLFNEMPEKLGDCDLDCLFNNSLFKSTFLEYVEKNISVKTESSDEKMYYMFSTAYQILNTLGLDSEKNKKSKFKNTSVDGSHAYYAGFCDILVTDDNGLIEKG